MTKFRGKYRLDKRINDKSLSISDGGKLLTVSNEQYAQLEKNDQILVQGNYSQRQMNAAFELVKPKPHWKSRIDATIPADKIDGVTEAVIYFTGSVPDMIPIGKNGNKIRVRAAGYWATIGA